MTSKKPILLSLIAVILVAGMLTGGILPVHALSQGVSLDANSISQTDNIIQTTFSRTASFRIGAVVANASATNPINTVYGWQFTINYNASAFVPQGDPSAASLYPDGAANTVLFGANTGTGQVSWAALIGANQAFGGSTISTAGSNGQITVFVTLISPAPAVTIAAINQLASVSFELLPGHQVAAYSFSISNVIFVNNAGAGITGPVSGAGSTETVTNNPPTARMSSTNLPTGDPSCVPTTGTNCTAYAYSFDGSASTDSDGTITNPTGYFWDFGDGVQDLATSGPVAVHDYGAFAIVPGKFNVTLRVQDNGGATGAARDSLGNVILNVQPSHTQILNFLADQLPTASFTATPSTGSSPLTVNFDGTASTDADGTVAKYFWNFGDNSPVQTTTAATTSHVYTATSTTTFTASLIVQDNTGGNSTSTTHSIMVTAGVTPHPTTTTIACSSPVVINQGSTCTVTVTDTSATGATTPTGTVSLGETGVTGTFTTCTLSGATASATCTSTFTASTSGTASVTANYPGDTTHVASSGTTSIVVNQRATTTTVSCTTPVVINQGSTCTVTVTDTSPGTFLAPTGTVALGETGVTGTFTTCTLAGTTASATCTSTFTASTAGTAAVTASYPGDSAHSPSSGTTSITVNPIVHATTTSVTCNNPVAINQGSTCTVTVTDTSATGATTPTGTVALTETGVTGSFTTCTLAGTTPSATCTSTFTASTSGTAAISASYPGDTSHATSGGTISITVNLRTTTTTVNCTSPVVINVDTTCSVTVTDNSPGTFITPTGTITFTETGVSGSFTPCILAGATASATCTSTFTATTAGTTPVTASYPGDTSHSSSSGATSLVVNPRATSTTITCTSPVVINQGSTCSVTVTDTSPGPFVAPNGTLTLSELGVSGLFTTCTLSGTTAATTCTSTFTATTSGTATVTADYPGDISHAASSGTTSIVVNPRSTTTTVSCSPTSISPGQATTCTATVNDPATNPGTRITPTGTVTFTSTGAAGTFTGSPCNLVAGTLGTATCQVTFTAGTGTGTANIVGTYGGDSTHVSSPSTAFPVTIGLAVTTTTVTCLTPVLVNQGSACTVSVTDTSTTGATTPTGTVTLTQTGVTGSFTSCSLSGTTATATCTSTFTATTSGTASVTATYLGDTSHGGSQGTTSIVVNPRNTITVVTCSSPVVANEGSTCNVTVTDSSPGTIIAPSGTVALSETGVTGSFTTCTLSGTLVGTCSSTFTATTSGTANVMADYPGDTAHLASSGTASVTVNPRATSTTVNCTTPVNVNSGSTCDVTVTDTSAAGTFLAPTGTVTLSQTGVTGSFTTCALAGTTASATCTSTFTPTTGGTASVSTDYPGDSAHSSSSGTTSVTVNQPSATTTTTVSCVSPVLANEGSTCNVTVTDTSTTGATTPTGTVTLTENGVTGSFTICTLAGTTASATCTSTLTATTSGTAAITAAYPGDTTHAVSSDTTSVTVNPRTTTTTLSCTGPVNVGQGSTCDVTVTDTSVAGTFLTPTGTVALAENGVTGSFTTCTLAGTTASATCTSTFTASTAGTAAVTASYPGDAAHDLSSGTASITVNAIVGVPTVTVNSPTPNPATTGQTVTVTFTASSTATITGITVDWGDGTSPDTLSGTSTSDTHVYASTGTSTSETFTITVTATNSAGPGSGTTTETVNDRPPVASFTFNPTSPSAGQTVSFDTSASADPDGTVVSYAWDFGDGATGTDVAPTHVYSPAATTTFIVMLTVTDNSGSTGSTSQSITVSVTAVNPPVVTITGVVPNPANTGQTVNLTFTVSSTATVTGITVNWGDGTVSDSLPGTATSDTHNYANTGNAESQIFTITVTATNSGGAGLATTTETINDRPPVVTISTVTPNPANTGQTVTASFTATDPDGTISSITVNWGDSSTPDTLGGTATSDTHSYTTAGNFTITVTATDNSGSTGAATTIETVKSVTTTPILLTFQAFNFTAFHNGFGSFQVLVNGHVVTVVNIPFVRSATITNANSASGANTFVNFGPFDITSFVILGQNNITFVNPTSSRFSLIKNVVIMQDNTIFLNVTGARFVSPGRPVTFTFSNPPLKITSFTISSSNPFVKQHVTFTATYTGGTGPFKCLFRFGDGNLWGVQGKNGSCNVTPDYHFPGTFTATVRITGSTTADRQTMTLPTKVTVEPDTVFTTTSQDVASQSETANNLHSFSLTVTNPSSHTIVFRVDVLVTRPDGSQTWVIGQSYTLQPDQTTNFTPQAYPPAGQHGAYNFKAALKFGIDNNNDSILQNSEKIVTSGYLFGNFTVP